MLCFKIECFCLLMVPLFAVIRVGFANVHSRTRTLYLCYTTATLACMRANALRLTSDSFFYSYGMLCMKNIITEAFIVFKCNCCFF